MVRAIANCNYSFNAIYIKHAKWMSFCSLQPNCRSNQCYLSIGACVYRPIATSFDIYSANYDSLPCDCLRANRTCCGSLLRFELHSDHRSYERHTWNECRLSRLYAKVNSIEWHWQWTLHFDFDIFNSLNLLAKFVMSVRCIQKMWFYIEPGNICRIIANFKPFDKMNRCAIQTVKCQVIVI